MKKLYSEVLEYIDSEEDIEEHFENLLFIINEQKICENSSELRILLRLLTKIAKYHYRESNFFDKITRILKEIKNDIQTKFSNAEIFQIFKRSKRLLLYLIDEQILTLDSSIVSQMAKYEQEKYTQYFTPEIKQFLQKNKDQKMYDNLLLLSELPEDFYSKRLIGENDNYLSELIRKDSIEEFIIFIKKHNYKLKSDIEASIFETNSFLLHESPKLIEYAAFFGSVQIFKYLTINGVEIQPSLWRYAVHSNNQEMIDFLENEIDKNQVQDENVESFPYKESVLESIQFHNNQAADYILNKYEKEKYKQSLDVEFTHSFENHIQSYCFRYYNFAYFPSKINGNGIFFYFCIYDYFPLVKIFLSIRKFDIDEIEIIITALYDIFKFNIQ